MKRCVRVLILIITVSMLMSLAGCGGSKEMSGLWRARSAAAMGVEISVESAFDGSVSIEFKSGKKCSISVGDKTAKGKWQSEDGVITAAAGGLELSGELEDGFFLVENVMGSGIKLVFEKIG